MKLLTLWQEILSQPTQLQPTADVADASIKTAGSEGNPFYSIYWLAK